MAETTPQNKEQIISLIIDNDLKLIEDDSIRHFIEQRLKDGNPPSTEEILSFGQEKGISNENLKQSIRAYTSIRERNSDVFNKGVIPPLPVPAEIEEGQSTESLDELATKPIEVSTSGKEKIEETIKILSSVVKNLLKIYFSHEHNKLNLMVEGVSFEFSRDNFEGKLDSFISNNATNHTTGNVLRKLIPEMRRQITTSETKETLQKVNINTADAKSLETLPHSGPLLAENIIKARERMQITSVDQLGSIESCTPELANEWVEKGLITFDIELPDELIQKRQELKILVEEILDKSSQTILDVKLKEPLSDVEINILLSKSGLDNDLDRWMGDVSNISQLSIINNINNLESIEEQLREQFKDILESTSPEPAEDDRIDENNNDNMTETTGQTEQLNMDDLKQELIVKLTELFQSRSDINRVTIKLGSDNQSVVTVWANAIDQTSNLIDQAVINANNQLNDAYGQQIINSRLRQIINNMEQSDYMRIVTNEEAEDSNGQENNTVNTVPSEESEEDQPAIQDETDAATEPIGTPSENDVGTENQETPITNGTSVVTTSPIAGRRQIGQNLTDAGLVTQARDTETPVTDQPNERTLTQEAASIFRQSGNTRNRARRAANPNHIPTTPDNLTPNAQRENGVAAPQPETQATLSTTEQIADRLGMTTEDFNQVQINQPENQQPDQPETPSEQEQLQQTIEQRSRVLASLREQIAAVREGRTQATNEQTQRLIENYQRTATLLAQAETDLANYELTRQNLNDQMDTILGVEPTETTEQLGEQVSVQNDNDQNLPFYQRWWRRITGNRQPESQTPQPAEATTETPVATATPQTGETAGNAGTPSTAESGGATQEDGTNERPRGLRARLRNWWNTTNKLAYASGALIGAASTAALASWLPIPGVPAVIKTTAIAAIAQGWNLWLKRSNERAFSAEDVQRLERNEKWNKNFRDAVAGIAAGSTAVAAFNLVDFGGEQLSKIIDIDFENTMTNEGRFSINWAGDEPNASQTIWETNWNNTTEMSPETVSDPFNTASPNAPDPITNQSNTNFGAGNGDPSTNGLIDTTTNSTIPNSGVQAGAQSGNPTTTQPSGGIFENAQEAIANTFDSTDASTQTPEQVNQPQQTQVEQPIGSAVQAENVIGTIQQEPETPVPPTVPDGSESTAGQLQTAADAEPVPVEANPVTSANYAGAENAAVATEQTTANQSSVDVTLVENGGRTTLEVPEQQTTVNETTSVAEQPVTTQTPAESVTQTETPSTPLETVTEAVEDLTENFAERFQRLNANVQAFSQETLNRIANFWQNGFSGGSFTEYLGDGIDFNNPEAVNSAINNMQIGTQGEALVYIDGGRLHGLTPSEWNINFPGPGGQDSVVFGLERGLGDDKTIFSTIGTIEDKLGSENISLNEFFNSIDTEAERAAFSSELSQSVNTARNTIGLNNITPQNINTFASNILTAVNNASN